MDDLLELLKAELEQVQKKLATTPISHQPYDSFARLRMRERILQSQIAIMEAKDDKPPS